MTSEVSLKQLKYMRDSATASMEEKVPAFKTNIHNKDQLLIFIQGPLVCLPIIRFVAFKQTSQK